MQDYKRINLKNVVVFICLSVFALATSSLASSDSGLLKIYFLGVGQGDAELIITSSGQQILIDGGPDDTIVAKLAELLPFYDKSIDLVVVSHKHSDHISGLMSVLERYNVGAIADSKIIYDTPEVAKWQELKSEELAMEIEPIPGNFIDLGNDTKITFLGPEPASSGSKNPNDDSLIIMFEYKNLKAIFPGDIESKGEKAILGKKINIDADLIKVSHHGSITSTTLGWLKEVSPEVAIIEVGLKNRYNHPSQVILSRLENNGIKYYRTDTDGDIKIVSDGNFFKVNKQIE